MVAIKDFGMPSCCMNCEMQIDGLSAGYYCAITEEELNDNIILEHRHPNCPLVEIEERKVGKWVLLDECANSGYYCSECHKKLVKEGWSDTVKEINFCPNCGADMRGAENGKK